jgi:CotH kinase protein/Lamin Tail Domain/Fibronectin type III domain
MRRHVVAAVVASVVAASVMGSEVAVAASDSLVISEIHYHPASDLDTDEFLELTNVSADAVDVSGWQVTEGITALLPSVTLAPGERLVLSPDPLRFQQLYGFAPSATYSGKLSNSGESIAVLGPAAVEMDRVTYADAPPWPSEPDGEGPSLELRQLALDGSVAEHWGASSADGGTPLAMNSINGTDPVFTARDVVASPSRPAPGEPVTISARLPVGTSASLTYKVMFGSEIQTLFVDDETSVGGPSDGVFSATIPGQSAGRLVRYRIDGVSNGNQYSSPASNDSIRYHGVVVTDPSTSTQLPVIEWFMEDAVYQDLLANHRYDDVTGPAVIAFNGVVYDGASMRVRGNSSRSDPQPNWKVEMAPGHTIDFGALMPYPVDEWALQNYANPLTDIGWSTARRAGARDIAITPVRSHRNGSFWSVGRLMELPDGTWRDAQDVDTWSIYKGDGGALARTTSPQALEQKEWLDKKNREDEDYTDVWQLSQVIDAPASEAQRAWLYDNVNIPVLINYMAVNATIRHHDSGWYNWYVARDTEGTGRWELWHWDLNWIFSDPAKDKKGEFLLPDNNKFTKAVLAYPEFREMYFRRLRTLADEFLTPSAYENQWDTIATPYLPDWSLDRAIWGGPSPATERSRFLFGLAERRGMVNNNTGPGKPIPASQSVSPGVVLNELHYDPATGQETEFVELFNPSATESVDLSGWTIDELSLTIAPGTVVLPRSHVIFAADDAALRDIYGPGNRLVGGEFSGTLPDDGGSVTLRDADRVVDQVTYGTGDPWPASPHGEGPSLERIDPALDSTLATSWASSSASGGSPGQQNAPSIDPDVTDPETPTGVQADALGPRSITLSWLPASDDRAVVGYRVSRDGVTVSGLIASTTFVDTGLAPDTAYSYTVRAVDGAGNESPESIPLVLRTTVEDSLLFGESWSQPDAAPWAPASWSTRTSQGVVDVQGQRGRLTFNDVAGANARAQLIALGAKGDSELLLSYQWPSTASGAFLNVFLRGSGGWQNSYRPRNGYGLALSPNSQAVTVKRNVNGTTTDLTRVATGQQVTTSKQWLRFRVVGSTIQFRTWIDGQPEPTGWAASLTDSSVTAAGELFLSFNRGSGSIGSRTVWLDDLELRDGT